jgi:hypothetical protein
VLAQATFDDSLMEEAIAKNHCTIGEAVEAGARAEAYLTMLTHFSQRYPKVPKLDHDSMQVCWAGWGIGHARLSRLACSCCCFMGTYSGAALCLLPARLTVLVLQLPPLSIPPYPFPKSMQICGLAA